jgi:hypothetical protein
LKEEMSKMRKYMEELCMSFRQPEKKVTKKGIKAMMTGADDSSYSGGNRLSSDSEENDKIQSKRKSRRDSLKPEFSSKFNPKFKGRSKSKHLESSGEDNCKVKKRKNKFKKAETSNEKYKLEDNKIRYTKLEQQAFEELAQFTSEDEDLIRLRKREHLENSIKKEQIMKSKRLESMLKNAAMKEEDSIEMTPSSNHMSRIVPEKHPYPFPQTMIQQPMNYNLMQSQGFYPEATFSANAHPFNQLDHQRTFSTDIQNPLAFSQNQPIPGHNFQYSQNNSFMHPGYGIPQRYQYGQQFQKPERDLDCSVGRNFDNQNMVFGQSSNSRIDLYDDKLFDLIQETEGLGK